MAKIISEIKRFKGGGMDQDSSPSDVSPIDYIESYNTRNTGTIDGEEGDQTDIESNVLIPSARQGGINKTLGSEKFKTVRKGYSIIFNSQGYNQITELDPDLGTETVIFEDITNSGGIPIMPLSTDHSVSDIKLIEDNYLFFTDGYSDPKLINLDRLKNGSLGVIRKEDILLIKRQPIKQPIFKYNDDLGRSSNLLRGHLFQIREQYVYLDYEPSAWSTISKRNVPENEATPSSSTDVTKFNNIIISVDAGSIRVQTLNIAARYDLLDWFLIKNVERSYVTALPNTSVDVSQEIYEAYDPTTNVYSFTFYNDGLYPNVDVLETDLDYDHVPLTAETAEVPNGNILALANIKEGYPRPVTDVTVNVSYYDPQILVIPTDQTTALKVTSTTHDRIPNSHNRSITIYMSGLPKLGDKITIVTYDIRDSSQKSTYTYTAILADQNNLDLFLQHLSASIPQPGWADTAGDRINFKGISYYDLESATISLANTSTATSKSISALKGNSSYQVALAYYDQYGRYFPIETDKRFVVNTKSIAQTSGLLAQINWQINQLKAPDGAYSYQWLISENTTHQSNLYVDGLATQTNGNYYEININPLKDFNLRNPSSILNYDYSEGDRVTFVGYIDPVTPGAFFYFNTPPIDVQVLGFEMKVTTGTTPTTDYILRIAKTPNFDPAAYINKNIMIEIYTPRKRIATSSTGVVTQVANLWYEFGERFDIINGNHSVLVGAIKKGDSYYKSREYTLATDVNSLKVFLVEDFNFSDYYKSNYTSYGRARIYDDEQGQIIRKASIRYSDVIVLGSKVNGITRFFGERLYGEGAGQTSSDYGGIYKLYIRDSYLICLQELIDGHIPVNLSILEDQAEQGNVAISDKLFNTVRYNQSGTYGLGKAKESCARSKNGTVYFIDPNNSLPIRDGYDGVKAIPMKMSKFFLKVLQQTINAGKKIYGFYDDFNEEYNVCIESDGAILTTFTFNDLNWKYQDDYTIDPSTLTLGTVTNGTIAINTTTGKAIFTPNNNYTGAAGFSYSFLVSGQTITKNECGVVIAGTTTVFPFYFNDLTGQSLNTQLTSDPILIGGINILVPISVTGGQYSINGGAFTSSGGFVSNGDTVVVRQTSSASNSTTTSTVLTVSGYSDSFDVTTVALVTINFSNAPKNPNPYVDCGLNIYQNGTQILQVNASSTVSGTRTVSANDNILIQLFHFPLVVPPPPSSTARLQLVSNDGVSAHDNTVSANTSVVLLDSYSFTVLAGKTYSVTSTSNSTATGYKTIGLRTNDNTIPIAGGYEVIINDNTTSQFVIDINPLLTGLNHDYDFNVLNDGGTMSLSFKNNESSTVVVTIRDTATNALLATLTVTAGNTQTFSTLNKNGVTVNIN